MKKKKLVIGITGASGAIYGYRLLKATSKVPKVETFVIVTETAEKLLKYECDKTKSDIEALATNIYDEHDFFAPIASGSFRVDASIIAPCSMKTCSAIATGYGDNLVTRAASIALKERWPLILLVRETPLSVIHLKNMLTIAEAGGVIMPLVPSLYFRTKNLEELIDITVGRVLDMVGIKTSLHREWKEE